MMMMGRKWMKALAVLPMAVLAACGGDVAGTEQAGENTQGVLNAPSLSPAPAGYQLTLTEQALTSQLEATLETGEDAYDYTQGSLRRFDFAWPYSGAPTLAQADAAVLAFQEYDYYYSHAAATVLTYPQLNGYLYSEFQPLHPQILSTYGNGVENVQVMTRYISYPVAPGADGWFRLNIILFPQSKKIIVFEQTAYET
jgi:hypothetical protein